ncbi:NACHT domain-containing protein [Rhodococcus sp. NPDC019627]|uniref:NACHT domain-containing protein n=1 Tax=unclassified Rhodococcus (in: high G+C Gram-positive bacteria) TaxID=192944 RepID=UPI00340E3C29
MPDYDINQLGDRSFEQLVVSLCAKFLGPGIQVFGDGPDGGREATFDGPINWSATTADPADRGKWSGYTVVQAKFHYHQEAVELHKNTAWLKGQIDGELNRWVESIEKGTRERAPKYLIIASNVRLSAKGKTGGIDTLYSHIRGRLKDKSDAVSELGLKDIRIWPSDQINTFLDDAESIRHAFPGLLTVGDVLARIGDHTSGASLPELGPAMRHHAAMCLHSEHWVRFSEAGATSGQKATLEEVGRDLPAKFIDGEAHRVSAIAHLIKHADAVLRRNIDDRVERPHWVIIGGPGQGKTTLSGLLAQIYRAELLARGPMTRDVEDIVKATRNAMAQSQIPAPRNLRWPMRIDLTAYAETLTAAPDTSVFEFLAQRIAKRSDQPITASQLQSWLRAWPWLVILDGLDEVSEASTRQDLMDRVSDLLTTADSLNADLLVVSTTRPLGYDERFDPTRFTELALEKLSRAESRLFSQVLVAARLKGDPDLQEQVLQRLSDAAEERRTRHLMETPLQVTIMSFIVESFGTLPLDRYSLFSIYFSTVYQREIDKRSPVSKILNEYRSDIEYLHYHVALQLHVESEGGNVESTMPMTQLEGIVRARLAHHAYTQREIDRVAGKLVEAATHRLVLLVPNDDRVGFEIRSLQELMTANALTAGQDDKVLKLLEITAHHPHWRNVWLLAAGRIFKEREYLHQKLVEVVQRIDSQAGPLNKITPTAPVLACNILADGFASRAPNTRRPYIRLALSRLETYPSYRDLEMAGVLAQACGTQDRDYLFDELVKGVKAGGLPQVNAVFLLNALKRIRSVKLKAEHTLTVLDLPEEVVRPLKDWYSGSSPRQRDFLPSEAGRAMTIRDILVRELDRHELFGFPPERMTPLVRALDVFDRVSVHRDAQYQTVVVDRTKKISLKPLYAILDDPDIETALALTLEGLEVELWPVATTVQEALRPLIVRRRVGKQVLEEVGRPVFSR